jgi:hypothetical protein
VCGGLYTHTYSRSIYPSTTHIVYSIDTTGVGAVVRIG